MSIINPYRYILSHAQEDRISGFFSELLKDKNILSQFLSRYCDIQSISDDIQIRTQVSYKQGRPDIVIEDDKLLLIFEAKVGADIDISQLNSYRAALTEWSTVNAGRTGLYLIASESDIRRLSSNDKKEIKESIECVPVSWQEISSFMSNIVSNNYEEPLHSHIKGFISIIEYRLGELLQPFDNKDILMLSEQDNGRSLWKSIEIVKQVHQILQDPIANEKGIEVDKYLGYGVVYLGFSFSFPNKGHWWYGFWLNAWSANGKSPIWLQLPAYNQKDRNFLPRCCVDNTKTFQDPETDKKVHAIPMMISESEAKEVVSGHISFIIDLIENCPESGRS